MVQAILEDRKTQTRRILKPQPDAWVIATQGDAMIPYKMTNKNPSKNNSVWVEDDGTKYEPLETKIAVGDILWVRETWCESNNHSSLGRPYLYKEKILRESSLRPKWKPSIFMPKAACRIFLEVTNVRVERLHDISNEDAKAEGIANHYLLKTEGYKHYTRPDKFIPFAEEDAARTSFFSLWMSINGAESLDANPWVWVYDFKRTDRPASFL